MPKRITVRTDLAMEELGRGYRAARALVERGHCQIIWLPSQGKGTGEVMGVTGYSRGWIQELARRYNQAGTQALADSGHHNRGGARRALPNPELREELGEALQRPPPDGGVWNSREVAEWIEAETGGRVGAQRGWEYLRLLGYSPRVHRARHAKADPEAQAEWRKNSPRG